MVDIVIEGGSPIENEIALQSICDPVQEQIQHIRTHIHAHIATVANRMDARNPTVIDRQICGKKMLASRHRRPQAFSTPNRTNMVSPVCHKVAHAHVMPIVHNM